MQGPNKDDIKAHVVDRFVRDEMNVHNFQRVEKPWVRKWANDAPRKTGSVIVLLRTPLRLSGPFFSSLRPARVSPHTSPE